MNKDEFFDSLLNSPHLVINYQEIQGMLADDRDEFDLIAALSYELSERVKTPQHYARAHLIVSSIGSMCLDFNLEEADNEHARALLELEELPPCDVKDVSCAIY